MKTDQVCWSNRDEVTREVNLYGSWYLGGWTWGGWDPAELRKCPGRYTSLLRRIPVSGSIKGALLMLSGFDERKQQ